MRRRRKKDLFLKFLALFFAFLLWFFVVLQDKIERELPLKLVFRNLPPNTLLLNVKPSTFRLKVIGPRSIMRSLSGEPLILSLDLSRYPPGRHILRIPPENIKLPSGLKPIEVIPQEAEILLDSVIQKWIKVKVDLRGELPEGFKVKEVRVRPASVRIKGARTVVRDLKFLYTAPVYLSERRESFKLEVLLSVPEGIVEVYPERVQVVVKIGRKEP